ncbi:MAG: hypothetical protein OEW24_04835, partial [Chloroflexota bacterium]|nr:hypothetical protein [Chloroflexota bacterium]
ELEFRMADLEASAADAARLQDADALAREIEPLAAATVGPASLPLVVADHRARFLSAMDDDLNTPRAIAELQTLASLAIDTGDPALRAAAGRMVHELGSRVLGLRLADTRSLPTPREPGEAIPA